MGEKKILINKSNEIIKWEYITELHELQEKEGLRLGNKLTKSHVHFKKQIMNVKLAALTFRNSVADAIEYCTDNFNIF